MDKGLKNAIANVHDGFIFWRDRRDTAPLILALRDLAEKQQALLDFSGGSKDDAAKLLPFKPTWDVVRKYFACARIPLFCEMAYKLPTGVGVKGPLTDWEALKTAINLCGEDAVRQQFDSGNFGPHSDRTSIDKWRDAHDPRPNKPNCGNGKDLRHPK